MTAAQLLAGCAPISGIVHSAHTPSLDIVKVLVRLENSEIMFSFVEGKTVWRIIGESVEDA